MIKKILSTMILFVSMSAAAAEYKLITMNPVGSLVDQSRSERTNRASTAPIRPDHIRGSPWASSHLGKKYL